MERFGENWRDHDKKIFSAWERIGNDEDLLLLVGDLSWAVRLGEAQADLDRIAAMKGTKIILKGNHDYWWQSAAKMRRALHLSIHIIQGDSLIINRVAVAGTRGWVCPNDSYFEAHDQKIYEREVGRLKLALDSLKGREADFDFLIVALHYPPTNNKHEASGFTELIDDYGADACVYGHLHGSEAIQAALTGRRGKTWHYLVSADSVDFTPLEIKRDCRTGV